MFADTFDIQNVTVIGVGDGNEVILIAEFMKHTTAIGYFVLLQSQHESFDVFRFVLRSKSSTILTSTIINIPSSIYNVFVYDLQQGGLPNTRPAYEDSKDLAVFMNGKSHGYYVIVIFNIAILSEVIPNAKSKFLSDASVLINKSMVKVECQFKDGIAGAFCVLVYRQFGNKVLVLEKYSNKHVFPVTIAINNDPGNYSFALFGMNSSDWDERPIVEGKVQIIEKSSSLSPTIVATSGSLQCHSITMQ